MAGKVPHTVFLYRIVHIDNLEYLLTHGMFTRQHVKADANYINIGDTTLITQRNDYPVKIDPPNGVLGDYIPFYFGPLSPMLLKIKNGSFGFSRRPQNEIVYIICRMNEVIQSCANWCFTDGHAKATITSFYNHTNNLDQVDWGLVGERYWGDTEDDFDRMRRKQAEFLVKEHVPVNCIVAIATYDAEAKRTVQTLVSKFALKIKVEANPGNNYFYG